MFGKKLANIFRGQIGWEVFIGIDIYILELKPCIAQKLMSAWRLRSQKDFGKCGGVRHGTKGFLDLRECKVIALNWDKLVR